MRRAGLARQSLAHRRWRPWDGRRSLWAAPRYQNSGPGAAAPHRLTAGQALGLLQLVRRQLELGQRDGAELGQAGLAPLGIGTPGLEPGCHECQRVWAKPAQLLT